jgi:hypothetical protein
MKPNHPNPALTDQQLDAALGSEQDHILPSSGFADAVMTAVRQQAAAPAPIPFPWKRALPGIVAAVLLLGAMLAMAGQAFFRLLRQAAAAPAALHGSPALAPFLRSALNPGVLWGVLSLVVPLICLLALRRMIFAR